MTQPLEPPHPHEGRTIRQEIEIRRRSEWLDFPARGIIRGRWEIGDYEFNRPIADSILRGPSIGGLLAADTAGAWDRPLGDAIAGVAAPVTREDLASLRRDLEVIAGARALSGLPATAADAHARMATPAMATTALLVIGCSPPPLPCCSTAPSSPHPRSRARSPRSSRAWPAPRA